MENEGLAEGVIPEKQHTGLRTEYTNRLTDVIREVDAPEEEREMAIAMVEQINRQVEGNLHTWEPKENRGVKVVHSRVSVLELVAELGTDKQKELARKALDLRERGELKQQEWVLFSSTPLKPVPIIGLFGADASPMTAMDIAYKYLLESVGKVAHRLEEGEVEDFVFVPIGSPMPPGGRITEEFLQKIKKDNVYWAEADLNTEFVEEELKDPNKRVTMLGQSHGATLAEMTAVRLEQRNPDVSWEEEFEYTVPMKGGDQEGQKQTVLVKGTRKRVRVLSDDPTVSHGGEEGSQEEGKRMIIGAVKAGLNVFWERRKDYWDKVTYITRAYKKALGARGIEIDEDNEQKRLKSEAYAEIKRDILEGPRRTPEESLEPERIKVFKRQGTIDETLQDPTFRRDWESYEEHDLEGSLSPVRRVGSTREYGYKGGHAMDRFVHPQRFLRAARILLGGE